MLDPDKVGDQSWIFKSFSAATATATADATVTASDTN